MSKNVKGQTEAMRKQLADLEAMRKRLVAAAKPDGVEDSPTCIADIMDRYPSLHLAMMAHMVEGGPDEGATITLWGKAEGLGGVLNVKPMGVRAFIDAGTVVEWLQTAEDMLNDPQAKWHKQKPARGRSRHRGKQGREWS